MSLDHLFGELRAILHHPTPSQGDLHTLLNTAQHLAPEQYQAQWRPHLAGHQLPLFYANTLEQLERLTQLLPDNAQRMLRLSSHVSQPDANAMIQSEGFQWVTHLSIDESNFDLFTQLESHLPVNGLHTLRIGSYLSDLDVIALMHHPIMNGLKALRLEGYAFHNRGVTSIARSPHMRDLHALHILGNSMSNRESNRDAGLRALTTSTMLQNLHTLDLSHQQLGEPLLKALGDATHWSTMRSLMLTRNNLERADLAHIAGNAALWRDLHTLSLHGNDIFDITGLTEAPCHDLRTLDLAYNALNHSAIAELVEMPLHQLEALNLSYNALDAASMATIVSQHQWSNLKSFQCHGNPLGDEGVATWLRDKRLWPTSEIKLSCMGLKTLCCFGDMEADLNHILDLYLDENHLTAQAMEDLTRSPIWPQLKYVVLSDNQIDDTGVNHLSTHGHANLCISVADNDTSTELLNWDCTGELEVTYD